MKTLSFVFFFFLSCSLAVSQNTIQSAIDQFSSSSELQSASISFLVTETSSGKVIASKNALVTLPTASTAKLFATAGAIELLGKDYRPSTRIYIDGPIVNGVLDGNIVIRGGGDVTLGSKFFNEEGKENAFFKQWVDTIKKIGITSVTGKIIADGSEFGYNGVPDGWAWTDMGNYYGAGPSGICIYDNTLKYYFKTGSSAGQLSELQYTVPKISDLVFRNYVTAENVSGDNSYIFGAPFSNDRFATGSLPLNSNKFEVKGSLPDPEYLLALEFSSALMSSGISIKSSATGVRNLLKDQKPKYDVHSKLIYTHYGATVGEIAKLTNMKSINLFAEGLVCLVGYKTTKLGTTDEGLRLIEAHFKSKTTLNSLFLKDGSGLSRSNGISATHFCNLLNYMASSVNHTTYFNTLPTAGKSGTIASLCRGEAGEGRVFAKSGTMNRIKSYAGYIYSKSGKKMTFSFTVNNFSGSSSSVTNQMEKVLNAIALY
jgi:D-alanyl-D-alanine carboxypeptidase/D-alanyl-D-alanine-endopeptidase (penicillin-binding protein 4)